MPPLLEGHTITLSYSSGFELRDHGVVSPCWLRQGITDYC